MAILRLRAALVEGWKKAPSLIAGGALMIAILLFATVTIVASPYGATEHAAGSQLEAPSPQHLFGTDLYGMDVLTRTAAATFYNLPVALLATILGAVVGSIVGTISAYSGGGIDTITMRVMDGLQAFPVALLAIAMVVAVGGSAPVLVGVIALTQGPNYVRVARATTLSLKQRDFVRAARAMDLSTSRIVVTHILPNELSVLGIQASLNAGRALLIMSALGFLGLGAQPPTPEWGLMVSLGVIDGQITDFWTWVPAGIAIVITTVGLSLIGDGMQEIIERS